MKNEMKELIVNAVRLIEEHGWCQETAMNGQGNLCIAGGLGAASQGIESLKAQNLNVPVFIRLDTVFRATMDYLEKRLGMPVPNFNDVPGRKWETVKAILMEAAEYLDEMPEVVGSKPIKLKMSTGMFGGSFAKHMAEHVNAIDAQMIGMLEYGLTPKKAVTATQKAMEHGA